MTTFSLISKCYIRGSSLYRDKNLLMTIQAAPALGQCFHPAGGLNQSQEGEHSCSWLLLHWMPKMGAMTLPQG